MGTETLTIRDLGLSLEQGLSSMRTARAELGQLTEHLTDGLMDVHEALLQSDLAAAQKQVAELLGILGVEKLPSEPCLWRLSYEGQEYPDAILPSYVRFANKALAEVFVIAHDDYFSWRWWEITPSEPGEVEEPLVVDDLTVLESHLSCLSQEVA